MPDHLINLTAMLRASGALLGLAVGDAFGTTLEFRHIEPQSFAELVAGPHVDIVGGGPFEVAPGQVTDDTQMASALCASLYELGHHDAVDVAARYVDWRRYAFDIGGQTSSAIARIADGTDPLDAGRLTWEASGKHAAGNGSLMRTAPIGVVFAEDGPALTRAAIDDSATTHFDPRCLLACAAFNAAIANAITTASPTAESMLAEAERELDRAAEHIASRWPQIGDALAAARQSLGQDLAAATEQDPQLYGPDLHIYDTQGFVRVAFRLAFWELVHAPDFVAGVVDAVNRGGDADTNGAIVGALLGARYSMNAIPKPWLDRVLHALPPNDADPLTTHYHPRAMFSTAP